MDTFQISVLIVAAVILIIIFTTIGILSSYAKDDNVFPPNANTCPDNWTVNADGTCSIPAYDKPNIGNIYNNSHAILLSANSADVNNIYTPGYTSGTSAINFSDNGWSAMNKTPVCAKKNWATTNSIKWDGISNYNSC